MLVSAKQAYLTALVFSSIFAWASFLSIIFFINPQSAGLFGVIILYLSGAAGLSTLSIILWQIIKLKKKN